METILIGSDHAGFVLKEHLRRRLESAGFCVKDYGTCSEESMDYPDVAHPLACDIQCGKAERGILICGSGNGVSMVANKYPGVRAALCWNPELASLARQHNNANILTCRHVSFQLRRQRPVWMPSCRPLSRAGAMHGVSTKFLEDC